MSYARVGLVVPPLLDREITALSECARGGRILSMSCVHAGILACIYTRSGSPQDDAASH